MLYAVSPRKKTGRSSLFFLTLSVIASEPAYLVKFNVVHFFREEIYEVENLGKRVSFYRNVG